MCLRAGNKKGGRSAALWIVCPARRILRVPASSAAMRA